MLLSAKHYESCRHQRDPFILAHISYMCAKCYKAQNVMNHVAIKEIPLSSPPSSVEIKPGYPASMKLLLSLPTIMSKCCFFTFLQSKCL